MATFTATLLENERLADKTYVLHLAGCEPLADCKPGQFVMLRGEWGRDPLLPRAFSVMSIGDDGVAEILVKTVGRGTALLEVALPGARFQVLGPLGTAFPEPSSERSDWLVAGGVGLAPLLFYLERAAAAARSQRIRVFYGGRSASDLVLVDRLAESGARLHLATDDGTRGAHGRVTALLEPVLAMAAHRPTLMGCGPDPMLIALSRLARARGLPAYLSLEGEMACGIGVCLGCAVPCATRPYRYTCTDGPVMSLDELRGPYA
jgi:dihydroorotate dehydrogenase electron transfer subunit